MKRAVAAIAALALLTLTQCATFKRIAGNKEEQKNADSKLKSTTDRVVLETYYGQESFSPPAPPVKTQSRYTKMEWHPGEIRFQGVVMVEPLKDMGHEPKKDKGVEVELSSIYLVMEGRKGEQRRGRSFLHETEVRDFDAALTYLAEKAAEWEKHKPDPKQDVTYSVRDTFGTTLAFDDEGMAIFVRSGDSFGMAALRIPASSIGEVQAKLRAVLKSLDEH